jgi:putative hydrolase of the HAD superfamily|tara:strand:- start:20338 stop:21033 length:696 start_codon:yes stop_codon:yes gene_type:complete
LSKYQHIFFDLDHTLWDYDANAAEALHELYEVHKLEQLEAFTKQDLVAMFFEVNHKLWDLYNHHRIGRADIRKRRFPEIFHKLRVSPEHLPATFEEEYVALAPTKSRLFDYATEVLDYLSARYKLHLITNGFDDIQHTKLRSSNLTPYFQRVITSESSRSRKPNPRIFEVAFELTGADCFNSIMIGDNLDSDIAGAKRVDMDHVWFNPTRMATNVAVQHEISNLLELKSIL